VNCERFRYSQSELTAIWGLGSGRKWNGPREGKVTKRQDAAIRVEEEAISVKSYKLRVRDLDLEHTLDAGSSGDLPVQVWSQSDYLPARRSNFRASTQVHVSRDR